MTEGKAMSDLGQLLDALIQQTFLDSDEEWEDYSPATNSIRNAIIERYGKVDNATVIEWRRPDGTVLYRTTRMIEVPEDVPHKLSPPYEIWRKPFDGGFARTAEVAE